VWQKSSRRLETTNELSAGVYVLKHSLGKVRVEKL
jgi:hypothetical protein